jgi:hypothetical protein
VGDLATFSTKRGLERVWVPGGEESEWIARFGRMGIAAARWSDYTRWGRRFYPPTNSADRFMSDSLARR